MPIDSKITSKIYEVEYPWMRPKAGMQLVKATVLVIGALVFFLATWVLAMEDKASSATVTGAVGFGFALLYFLPLVESIEGFGLSAKLRWQVNEAESLLRGIRNTAAVASKVSIEQLAWLNRSGAPGWATKRELLSEISANLIEIGVDDHTIGRIREPFLRFISLDLYRCFARVLLERLDGYRQAAEHEIKREFGANKAIAPEDRQRHQEALQKMRKFDFPEIVRADSENRSFSVRDKVAAVISATPFSAKDIEALQGLGNRISDLAEGCAIAGTITLEAEAYLEQFGAQDRQHQLFEQTFGVKPGTPVSAVES